MVVGRGSADGANLQDALLIGADLHGSTLLGINLRGCDLTRADLWGAVYDKHTLTDQSVHLSLLGAKLNPERRRHGP